MELCDEFRIRAQRCLALAGAASTLDAQSHWLSMAQLWLNLAQFAESQDRHSAATELLQEPLRHSPR
jgi:hypothetical protein